MREGAKKVLLSYFSQSSMRDYWTNLKATSFFGRAALRWLMLFHTEKCQSLARICRFKAEKKLAHEKNNETGAGKNSGKMEQSSKLRRQNQDYRFSVVSGVTFVKSTDLQWKSFSLMT